MIEPADHAARHVQVDGDVGDPLVHQLRLHEFRLVLERHEYVRQFEAELADQLAEHVGVLAQFRALHWHRRHAGRRPRDHHARPDAERRAKFPQAPAAAHHVVAQPLQILARAPAADHRDKRPEHVVGSLADRVDPRVAHPAFDGVAVHVALATPDLQRVVDDRP